MKKDRVQSNPFKKAFQVFDEETFFQNLHERVRNKPYFQQYKGFKQTLLALSYLFNVASAITASYAIYWLIHRLTGVAEVGWIVAIVFLFFLEQIKRRSSGEFWQVLFFRKSIAIGWLGLSLFCLSVSLLSSGFGVKEGTEQLAPSAELLKADSMAVFYQSEIAKLETKGSDMRNNRDKKGITFYKLSDGITANEKVIADYRQRARALEEKVEGKNEKLSVAYIEEIQLTAWTLVWLTLLMELLFEACIAYVWYYYYRSYVERLETIGISGQTASDEHVEQETIMSDRIQALERQISDLKAVNTLDPTKPNKKYKTNGNSPRNSLDQHRLPIGFFSNQYRQQLATTPNNTSEQVRTDVDTSTQVELADKFTIAHTYTKGGQSKTVHYTERMINSRIGQYKRDLTEAIRKSMNMEIIENRKRWLNYWQLKKAELQGKSNTQNSS